MSTSPSDLDELGRFLVHEGYRLLGIVGDASHRTGYHLGSDRTRPGDYSTATARDRRGLTLDASAVDVGGDPGELRRVGRRLLASCIAGAAGARDMRELGAEAADGSIIWRWDQERGTVSGDPSSTERIHHLHAGYYRDSRARDKRPLWARAIELGEDDDDMHTLYGTGGQQRTLEAGTPVYDQPNGRQVGEIPSDRVVYRLAAEVRLEGAGRWWLLDGETSGSPLRYVRAVD